MLSYLITVRDDRRETECTSIFEANNLLAALKSSVEYYAAVLERPTNRLRVVSLYPMEEGL